MRAGWIAVVALIGCADARTGQLLQTGSATPGDGPSDDAPFDDAPMQGSDAGTDPDGGMGSDGGTGSDAGSDPDGGMGSDAGPPDAGTGPDAGPPDAGPRPDADTIDAATYFDAHRGSDDAILDRTSFYTCASCSSGHAAAQLPLVIAIGAIVLRRRRR